MNLADLLKYIQPSIYEVVGLTCDVVVAYIVYSYLQNKKGVLHAINTAVPVENNKDLKKLVESSPTQSLVCVVADSRAKPVDQNLPSKYVPELYGVVQLNRVKEHVMRWSPISRMWSESDRIIDESINHVPFTLVGKDGSEISISELPQYVDDIHFNFSHSVYNDYQSSAFNHIADWFSGLRSKGVENIEKLILSDSKISAFGELVVLEKNNNPAELWLQAPKHPAPFILGSNVSHSKLIESATGDVKLVKVLLSMVGVAGAGILAYIGYGMFKKYKLWLTKLRVEEERDRKRKARKRCNNSCDVPGGPEPVCIICSSNPREILLKDCGHVCLCLDCYPLLKTSDCPVCRQKIVGYHHAFIP